jgi:hypothetical protein
MFFRSPRKRRRSEPAAVADAPDHQAEQLHDWRRSAQKVSRAWNAWLAADTPDRDARYGDYEAALAAEELAAARVERMLRRRAASWH